MTHLLSRKTSTHLSFTLAILAGASSFSVSACSSRACEGGTDCFSSPEQPSADGLGGDSGSKKPGVLNDEDALAMGGNGGATPETGGVEPPTPEEPGCVASLEPDAPDDDFSDTNCDGIDGDIASAVFVSPLGNDSDVGTIENPVLTLAEGIRLAQENSLDVYVCNATYAEPLNIEDIGVNIFGGYDCGKDWRRGASLAVVSPSSGTPLLVQNVTGVRIEQLRFRAAAATTQGGSSIGGVIVDSKEVQLHAVAVEAGAGFSGADGSAGAVYSTAARAGASATGTCTFRGCSPGGKGGYSNPGDTCSNGLKASVGGRGGDGGNWNPVLAPTNGSGSLYTQNLGGIVSSNPSLQNGKPGYNVDAAANGTVSPSLAGTFQGVFYIANNSGADGALGGQAKGGGGGAGAPARFFGDIQQGAGDGGGQGGFGGCGGRPGTGGTGGGGSFGLVVANSELRITMSDFSTSEGGRGGAGGLGAAGQLGGAGGRILGTLSPGGAGGPGGNGGKGGDGAPGGGGPSVVVALLSGDAPVFVESTLTSGDGGLGGKVPAGGYGPVGLSSEGYNFALKQELQF